MAVQAPPTKPVVPNKNEKPSEELKSSPDLSDDSQEVFEENFAAVVSKAEVVAVNSADSAKTFSSSSPVTPDSTQTTSSAWKPYRQSPQSMGACTSAVTTTGSSSVTVVSSHNAESRLTSARQGGNVTASYKAFHLQENPGVQTQGQSRINRVGDSKGLVPSTSQENWEPKVLLPRAILHLLVCWLACLLGYIFCYKFPICMMYIMHKI